MWVPGSCMLGVSQWAMDLCTESSPSSTKVAAAVVQVLQLGKLRPEFPNPCPGCGIQLFGLSAYTSILLEAAAFWLGVRGGMVLQY